MNTKYTIYSLVACLLAVLSSCSDFTDIDQKGKNLLQTTDELEMLLNTEFYVSATDQRVMCGDMIYAYSPIANYLSQPNKTRNVIMWTWDADNQDKMAELTNSDDQYTDFYGFIGKICNPILSQIDAATGDEAKKKQLKCKALTLRAWAHYILVNKYAKAYNPATAATDPGIIIMTEDKDITTPQSQSTVQECYDQILKDVNEAIELDGLPTVATNRMRMCKPAAYALKALVLQSMQQWTDAEAAAKQALSLNGTVSDYTQMVNQTITGYMIGGSYSALLRTKLQCEEDLFYVHDLEFFDAISPEAQARLEKGNYAFEKIANANMMYDYLMDYAEQSLGVSGYVFTYDLSSGWNSFGLKTTDAYLVVAEAEIHSGNIDAAMEALDAIRVCRIDPDLYAPLKGNVSTEAAAIKHLKQTSDGEGLYSCWNFYNRKRWNQVSGWEETLTKDLLGTIYTLTPESPMWIFPFPMSAINNNPNLKQNYK